MLITKGQSILDRKKKKKDRGLYPTKNVPMVRRMVIAALCRGEPFFADLTLFERSSNLRDHLTLPPTRGGARRTRVILEARITAPLSAFIKAGLFFLSLLISSPALPRRKLRSSFSSTTRKESTPPLPLFKRWGLYRMRIPFPSSPPPSEAST